MFWYVENSGLYNRPGEVKADKGLGRILKIIRTFIFGLVVEDEYSLLSKGCSFPRSSLRPLSDTTYDLPISSVPLWWVVNLEGVSLGTDQSISFFTKLFATIKTIVADSRQIQLSSLMQYMRTIFQLAVLSGSYIGVHMLAIHWVGLHMSSVPIFRVSS